MDTGSIPAASTNFAEISFQKQATRVPVEGLIPQPVPHPNCRQRRCFSRCKRYSRAGFRPPTRPGDRRSWRHTAGEPLRCGLFSRLIENDPWELRPAVGKPVEWPLRERLGSRPSSCSQLAEHPGSPRGAKPATAEIGQRPPHVSPVEQGPVSETCSHAGGLLI